MNQTAKRTSGMIHDQSRGYSLIRCCVVWITRCPESLRYCETCCTWRQRQHKYDTPELNKLWCSSSSRLLIMWTGVHRFVSPDSLSLASVSPCLLPTLSSRLLQLIPPPVFIHPTLMLLAVPAIVPLVQSGRAKRSSSSLPTASPPFDSDWCREPPGSESSPTALLWLFSNRMRQKMIVHVVKVVSRFKVVSSVSSWWWKDRRRKEQHENRKFDLPIPVLPPRLLFSLFASLPPSFFISPLGPFQFFYKNHFCCLVWRSKKTQNAFISSFSFHFHVFGNFHTSVRCSKPSSADWSESGKLCHQAGLIFTSICWVKTLQPQLRISDYQPAVWETHAQQCGRQSECNFTRTTPTPVLPFYSWLHFTFCILYFFCFYQCSLFPVYHHLFQ